MDSVLSWLNQVPPAMLQATALAMLALALLLVGGAMLERARRQARSRQVVDAALARGAGGAGPPAGKGREPVARAVGHATRLGERWSAGSLGGSLLAHEDRVLVDVCGFENGARARALFVFGRVALACGLPLLFWLLLVRFDGWLVLFIKVFVGFALGWMLPKWLLQYRAAARRRMAAEELPLLIDLLRLLQGVGLSMDQSLHVVVTQFRHVLPVLAFELGIAVERYARGAPREQSMSRLSTGFDNDDLAAIVRLITQVDQHGGAIQEPLRLFSDRLRERRRMELKERVGKLTVKMTGVMVLTLLPALLVVTGGAGLLAVLRGLSRVAGG